MNSYYLLGLGFGIWIILIAFMLMYVIVGPKRFKILLQGLLLGIPMTIYILGKMYATLCLQEVYRPIIGKVLLGWGYEHHSYLVYGSKPMSID